MTTRPIRSIGDPVLRALCDTVPPGEITGAAVHELIADEHGEAPATLRSAGPLLTDAGKRCNLPAVGTRVDVRRRAPGGNVEPLG